MGGPPAAGGHEAARHEFRRPPDIGPTVERAPGGVQLRLRGEGPAHDVEPRHRIHRHVDAVGDLVLLRADGVDRRHADVCQPRRRPVHPEATLRLGGIDGIERNDIVAPIDRVRKMVKMSISAVAAVLPNLSVTPDIANRFPTINMPIRGADIGTSSITITEAIMGNIIFSCDETSRSCGFMYIARSFLVVSNFIIGGWIMGTNAIYE